MNITIFKNNLSKSFDINALNKEFNYTIFNWENKYYLTDIIFPETNSTTTCINENKWNKLKLRPFKICPINYSKLLDISNKSILNICVFDEFNKIVGFVVISEKTQYYWIDILCTNMYQGVGTIIIDLIKSILTDKPIKLSSSFNAEKFYLKKGFVRLQANIMEYSN